MQAFLKGVDFPISQLEISLDLVQKVEPCTLKTGYWILPKNRGHCFSEIWILDITQ